MTHPDQLNLDSGHQMHRWHDLEANAVQQLIWDGEPLVGWSGDPNMLLMKDAIGWIVVTLEKVVTDPERGLQYYTVMRERAGSHVDLRQLPMMLALRDNHLADIEAKRISDNLVKEAADDALAHDKAMDAMDEVAFHVRRETSTHEGHTSKRFM